ncbi:hypothetical protein [Corallibacter vietnamensis]|uniref:Uncharacterized protein n=1 Tax=Corallibacter vietnamensis TaxID=904130 RepID=A0ABP7GZA5_9FLAO
MYNLKRNILVLVFTVISFVSANAQCAMCRAVLESEEGQATAKGINDGIIYLMAIPYILVGGIGFFIYRKFRTKKK